MTKLDAVNKMLTALHGEPPVSALDPGGASIQGEAETVLDRIDLRIQTLGWPDNTNFADALASSGSSSAETIQVPSTTLSIRGVAPHQYADVTLQGDLVYDNRRQTTIFPDTTIIYCDVVRKVTFVNLTPMLKELISDAASEYFAKVKTGDEGMTDWLTKRIMKIDRATSRHKVEIPTEHTSIIDEPEPVRESRR